jgi:hypothetical protein
MLLRLLVPTKCCCPTAAAAATAAAAPAACTAAASDKMRGIVWMSATAGQGAAPYRLVVQDDGNVVIFDAASTALWATNTGGLQGVLVQATAASNGP